MKSIIEFSKLSDDIISEHIRLKHRLKSLESNIKASLTYRHGYMNEEVAKIALIDMEEDLESFEKLIRLTIEELNKRFKL